MSSSKGQTFKAQALSGRCASTVASTQPTGPAHPAYAAPMGLWDALRALWAFFVLIGHFFLWLFNLGR